ncbi:hypothetical protein CHUAL_014148 [Chamberlinius hualienensis]
MENTVTGAIVNPINLPKKVDSSGRSLASCHRKELTLADKVEFIKFYEAQGGSISIRAAAHKFNIGKTAGFGILKRKEEYLKHYALNVDSSRRRMRRNSKFHEVNLCTWKWFTLARSRHLNVSGPRLQEKALKFSNKLGIENFKASNGWLESFKKCYNIHQQHTSKGNHNEIDFVANLDWKSKLPNLIGDQALENIFTCRVAPLLFRVSPHKYISKSLSENLSTLAIERLNVILCFSVLGEKLTPWVFGNCSAVPALGSNNIVWRTSEDGSINRSAFLSYLENINNQLQQKSRKIILFLDPTFNDLPELSNITFYLFPVNAITKCHPIDLGILHFFKSHYRKQLLYAVLPLMEALTDGGEVVDFYKCVTVTDALGWIAQAWEAVSHIIIAKSCSEAGFNLPHYGSTSGSAELLYCELSGLLNLLSKTVNADVVTVSDYIEIDNASGKNCEGPSEDEMEDQIAMEVIAERNASPEELLSLNLETDEEELHYPEDDKTGQSLSTGSDMTHKEALDSIYKLRNFAKCKENCLIPLLNELKAMMETLLAEKSKTPVA